MDDNEEKKPQSAQRPGVRPAPRTAPARPAARPFPTTSPAAGREQAHRPAAAPGAPSGAQPRPAPGPGGATRPAMRPAPTRPGAATRPFPVQQPAAPAAPRPASPVEAPSEAPAARPARRRPQRLGLLRQLRLAFGFFSILPVGGKATLQEIALSAYLVPWVALFLGAVEGLVGWGVFSQLNGLGSVTAALVLAVMMLMTGLHHADGLADLGDALMSHGGRSDKIRVLKDKNTGVGALGAFFLVYLISWLSISWIVAFIPDSNFILYMMMVEVAARTTMLLVGVFGKPSHEGAGSAVIEALKGWRGVVGLVLAVDFLIIVGLFTEFTFPLLALGAAVVVALLMIGGSKRWFGGANGDVLGASVELSRMVSMLLLLWLVVHRAPS